MRTRPALLATLVVALVSAALVRSPAQAASSQVLGSGSSWAANLVNQWVADTEADGLKTVYTATGSAQGRKDFASGRTDFAVSELPFQGTDPDTGADDSAGGREVTYLPVVSGGLAFTYQLRVGDRLVRDLRLSADTIAKIFTNQVTRWDDPAITEDNDGRVLPATPIIPVVRADGSGETQVFTSWLDQRFPETWTSCHGGLAGPTQYFPLNCGADNGPQKAQSGADGVMNYVRSVGADGAIAYVPNSYPVLSDYPVAAVENLAGSFVTPNPRTVWTALRAASVGDDGTLDLASAFDATSPKAYPVPYVGHAFLPTAADDPRMTTGKRQALVDFLFHGICRGQRDVGTVGYAPLPLNLVDAALTQIARLKAADAEVDLAGRDVASCENPTFDASTLEDLPPAEPTVTAPTPRIEGTAKVRKTLTASVPTPPADVSYTYQWSADGDPISGATSATYVPRVVDVGRLISVTVTPHRFGYASVPATSGSTQPVAASPVAIKRPYLKVLAAPTRIGSGRARVRIVALRGTTRLDGPTRTVLALRLGSQKIVRRVTTTFTNGTAYISVPEVPERGRWSATLWIPQSDLVLRSTTAKAVGVKVVE